MTRQILALTVILLAPAAGCRRTWPPPRVVESRVLMGTDVTITAWDPALKEEQLRGAVSAAFDRMAAMEALLSRHRKESELSGLNAQAGRGKVRVTTELWTALHHARKAFDTSGGAFDPTVGPLVRLWVDAAKADRVPERAEIDAALALVGFSKVELDEADATVTLPQGMSLDLGGIAKGYIVDEAAAVLKKAGVGNAIVEAGGDLFAFGSRVGKEPWKIGIQDPSAGEEVSAAKLAGVLRVSGRGVTTSGHYRRFSVIQGKRYSHILDPRTGFPVEQSVLSATVMAGSAAEADGLSTAVAVLGPAGGLELLERVEGAEGLLLVKGEGEGVARTEKTSGIGALLEQVTGAETAGPPR